MADNTCSNYSERSCGSAGRHGSAGTCSRWRMGNGCDCVGTGVYSSACMESCDGKCKWSSACAVRVCHTDVYRCPCRPRRHMRSRLLSLLCSLVLPFMSSGRAACWAYDGHPVGVVIGCVPKLLMPCDVSRGLCGQNLVPPHVTDMSAASGS